MATEKRLIDANGRYTLHASDNTDYSLLFRNGIICVENELGHCVCEFFAEDVPTVDAVEVVHGRWINPYMNRYGHPCHCCSICGFKASYQDKNYCPNCGAKMDGDCND